LDRRRTGLGLGGKATDRQGYQQRKNEDALGFQECTKYVLILMKTFHKIFPWQEFQINSVGFLCMLRVVAERL
jgi:hypothetical protein